jgi:hypothetical protein
VGPEVEGAIDWPAVERRLRARGVELRGANAEEAPGAYKDLTEVLGHHAGTVRVLHELTPDRRGDGAGRRRRPLQGLLCAEPAPNRCHTRQTLAFRRIPRHALRPENWQFAPREHDLAWVLETEYPA